MKTACFGICGSYSLTGAAYEKRVNRLFESAMFLVQSAEISAKGQDAAFRSSRRTCLDNHHIRRRGEHLEMPTMRSHFLKRFPATTHVRRNKDAIPKVS